jgi:hypothetical protein
MRPQLVMATSVTSNRRPTGVPGSCRSRNTVHGRNPVRAGGGSRLRTVVTSRPSYDPG